MNWSRAKTILIILFLLSDLFLLGNIMVSKRNLTSATPQIIESTVKILNSNNITIDQATIPKNILSVPHAEADNVIYDFDEFAKLFLGKNSKKSDDSTYKSEIGTISFSGDIFTYKSNTPVTSFETTEKDAELTAIEFLKSKGFDLSKAETNILRSNDSFYITFTNKLASFPIFNTNLKTEVSGDTVTSVSGVWFNISGAKGQDNDLKSVTSTLIDFIPLAENKATKITNISLGYTVPDSNLYHKSAVLVPVWEITESDGRKHYPDARTTE